jgi:hypothetical protein
MRHDGAELQAIRRIPKGQPAVDESKTFRVLSVEAKTTREPSAEDAQAPTFSPGVAIGATSRPSDTFQSLGPSAAMESTREPSGENTQEEMEVLWPEKMRRQRNP